MKTIGVLGGIGPQATMDFEARLHAVAQRSLPLCANEGYPPLVSVYLRHAPVAVGDNRLPLKPLVLDPRLLDAARRLGEWVDLIVIVSNTPHMFLPEIRDAAGCEVLSMIDVAVDELRRREAETVGLLGLGVPQVYAERFEREGFTVRVAPVELRDRLDDAILRLMEGRTQEAHVAAAGEAVAAVRATGAAATVLGCTEIPLLLGPDAEAPDLVNPTQLLAEAAVRRAAE